MRPQFFQQAWIKNWLRARTVAAPYAVALVAATLFLVLSAFRHIDTGSIVSSLMTLPIKDVIVNALGGFLGGMAVLWMAVGSRGFKTLRAKLSRPSVRLELGRAPENIFSGIELGAPVQLIEQKLGPPTRRYKDWWGYRFTDALVALTFYEDGSLNSIAVALTDTSTTFEIPTWFFDCPPLGKLTLKELFDAGHLELRFEESLRHRELRVTCRDGPAGAWHYLSFGALSPNIPGSLHDVSFDWNAEVDALVSLPEDVRINWAAIHMSSDFHGFPWDFAITI